MNLTLLPLGMIGPWQIIMLLVVIPSIVLLTVTAMELVKLKADPTTKLLWALVIVIAPLLGSILFLALKNQVGKK